MKKIEKASEVRIGNLYKEGNDFKEIDFTDLNGLLMGFDEWKLEPIPLTEEWLFKFGFEKTHLFDTVLYISNTNFHISFNNSIYQLNYKENPKSHWLPVCKDLKYIHQLQNLYFALTGEELTIKQQEQ
jgi:hypothetical protein